MTISFNFVGGGIKTIFNHILWQFNVLRWKCCIKFCQNMALAFQNQYVTLDNVIYVYGIIIASKDCKGKMSL